MRTPIVALWLLLCLLASSMVLADEAERRRVDISVVIFPRIVAVDAHFRDKLVDTDKARLLFVYDRNKKRAQALASRMQKEISSIGGVPLETMLLKVSEKLPVAILPTAIFLTERLADAQLEKLIAYARETQRLVFSPFVGDVERGVTVGISVGSRVKPYFNLAALRDAKLTINPLLMKMSKRYE